MATTCDNKTFKYDIVLSLDSNRFIYDICENFVTNLDNQKLLATTFNHRSYNLYEKNLIKAIIDDYNFDHLMFSIRPSALNFLKQIPDFNFIEFKDITQVIFVLQSMARYNIPIGIVSNRNLTLFNEIDEIEALELLDYLEKYLINFKAKVNKYNFFNLNITKLFCSIFSLTNMKNNLNGGKIKFI